jgi:DNA modification methylase
MAALRSQVFYGDALDKLRELPTGIVQTTITSPPYFGGLRDYGVAGQIGVEATPDQYVERLTSYFREVRRVTRPDGTLWLVIGDTHNRGDTRARAGNGGMMAGRLRVTGCKLGEPLGIPWKLAEGLRADGWWLHAEIIWFKTPTCMPESCRNRPTRAHETIFLFSRDRRHYYDVDAVPEPATYWEPPRQKRDPVVSPVPGAQPHKGLRRYVYGSTRRLRSVWMIPTRPYPGKHRATFPEEVPSRCIRLSTKPGDLVLDPFAGSGTTLHVARFLERHFVGVELNEGDYGPEIEKRLRLADQRIAELEAFRRPVGLTKTRA